MSTKIQNFTLQELKVFTNDFSMERRLGRGTYGEVFKGELKSGEEIAVKVLLDDSKQVAREQFQNEFDNLKKLEHHNIVKLVGYTWETQYEHTSLTSEEGKTIFAGNIKRAICTEYMPKGSLETYLSDEREGLCWRTRYKIIMGTCEGLKYLHDGIGTPFHHLDIKPDNILLDKDMEPKLADFGLSKCFAEDEIVTEKNSLGTPGYIPPEHIDDGIVSKEFDIFSLGVVMLNIVTGHEGRSRSARMPRQEFIDQVHEKWRRRLELISIGSRLEEYCQQVKTCIGIALDCIQPDRCNRPKIAYIVDELTKMDEVCRGWIETELISVHPCVLRFPSEAEDTMTCPLSLINRTDSFVGFVIQKSNCPDKYYKMTYSVAILEPKSTCDVTVSMTGQVLPPQSMDKLEVMMITMNNGQDIRGLHTLIVSEPNNQSKLLTRIEELGGKVQGTTLTVVVFGPATEPIITATTKIIPPKEFGDGCFLDMHPVEPWILIGHEKGYLSIWNYQTQAKGIAFEFLELRQGCRYAITSAIFIARKQWIVVGDSHGYINVYTCPTMKLLDRVKVGDQHPCTKAMGSISSLAVHPTKPCMLVSSSRDDKIYLWDWNRRVFEEISFGQTKVATYGTNRVIFDSMNADYFISTCFSGDIKLCIIGCEPLTAEGPARASFIDYTVTGGGKENMITMSPEGHATIWENSTAAFSYKRVHKFVTSYEKGSHFGAVMACHPSLPILATGSVHGSVCLWNTITYRLEKRVCCTLGEVFYVGFRELRMQDNSEQREYKLVIGCQGGIEILEYDLSIANQRQDTSYLCAGSTIEGNSAVCKDLAISCAENPVLEESQR